MIPIVACLFAALSQPAVPPTPGTVSGRVVEAGTQAPVNGVGVRLYLFGGDRAPGREGRQVTTGDDGRYTFEDLPPGLYRFQIIKADGFVTPDVLDLPEVNLKAGEPRDVVDIVLQREAVITGRIVDETGGPLIGGNVQLFRRSSSSANVSPIWRNRLMPSSNADADILGEFTLRGVPPGEYYVLAYPGPMDARNTRPLPTYFPNATNTESATRVVVETGQAVEAIVIQMVGAPAFQVSGLVVDENGGPLVNALVKLEPDEPPAPVPFTGVPGGHAHTDASGRFVVAGLISRRYTLLAIPPVIVSTGRPRLSVIRGSVGQGVRTLTRDGTTTQWEDAAGTKLPLVIDQMSVSDVKIVVRRPTR